MGEQGRGFNTEIKLCIISIGMEAETMAVDDLTKEEHRDGEEKGSNISWYLCDTRSEHLTAVMLFAAIPSMFEVFGGDS